MSLTIDVAMPRKPGLLPIFEISGEDDVTIGLLRNVRLDIEMPADDEGNPYLRVRLPDRKMLLIKSAPSSWRVVLSVGRRALGKTQSAHRATQSRTTRRRHYGPIGLGIARLLRSLGSCRSFGCRKQNGRSSL